MHFEGLARVQPAVVVDLTAVDTHGAAGGHGRRVKPGRKAALFAHRRGPVADRDHGLGIGTHPRLFIRLAGRREARGLIGLTARGGAIRRIDRASWKHPKPAREGQGFIASQQQNL